MTSTFIKKPFNPNDRLTNDYKNKRIHHYLDKNGFHLLVNKLTRKELDNIKSELTVTPKVMDGAVAETWPVYIDNNSELVVPRWYGCTKIDKNKYTNDFRDKPMNIVFKGNMRQPQQDVLNTVMPKLLNTGCGLVSLPCGFGKTTIALYIASVLLKQKMIVIVHKSFLLDQWIERAKQYTTAKIGILRQDKEPDADCDIVIAMAQSMSSRIYSSDIFDRFGFCCIDEAHHYGAPMFSSILYHCGAKYVMALSATPIRNDGLTKVIKWHCGDILIRLKAKPNKHVMVKLMKYHSNNKLFSEKKRFIQGSVKPDCVGMITNLISLESRNDHIINILNELRKHPERKVLILSERRDHVNDLKNRLDICIDTDIKNNVILKDSITTSFYIGGMKSTQRKAAEENADILFGTYNMAHEGLDIDRLNTIILATPKKDIIQAVGRIMRRILKNGDMRPLIIDICDELSIFRGQSKIRSRYYAESKYETETYYLNDSGIMSDKDIMMKNENITQEDADALFIKNKLVNHTHTWSTMLDLKKVLDEDKKANEKAEIIVVDPKDENPDSDDEVLNDVKTVDKKSNKFVSKFVPVDNNVFDF